MEKPFLISSLIEISFCKGILPKDSYTKVSYTVLRLASRLVLRIDTSGGGVNFGALFY